MSKFDFEKQRRLANAAVLGMKETQPFIFPEWQRLQQARRRFVEATQELEAAQAVWDKLGNSDDAG